MANYVLTTLLSLYSRLKLAEPLRLRVYSDDLVITGSVADVVRAQKTLRELTLAVKSALKRLQVLMAEELMLVNVDTIAGRVNTQLAARHLPVAVPVKTTRVSYETPANFLLAATIIEIETRLKRILQNLLSTRHTGSNPLVDIAVKRLIETISSYEYLLNEPLLRQLIPKASVIAGDERLLNELEARVRLNAVMRPREYRAYRPLLKLRRELRMNVHIIEKNARDFGERLALKLPVSKLYELYGFTLLLEALLEKIYDESWKINVSEEFRVLTLERGNERVHISYNALPQDVNSRLATAKAFGLLSNGIDQALVKKLGGLPDTILLMKIEGKENLVVVDYKYTRRLSYLAASRFKALSYLYEFYADCVIIVSPTVWNTSKESANHSVLESEELDEEAQEHLSFYRSISERGGALIEIDSNGKMLAIVCVDPNHKGAENAKKAFKKIFNVLLD
ncbi:MAG: hypothetical protein QXJ59_07885 [Thermofilaceae archaeon]